MNVLFFSTFHQSPHFLGLNLEFIQKNIDEGNKVYLIDCDGSFKKCGFNPYGLKYMCELCQYREHKGLNLLNGEVIRISLSELFTEEDHKIAQTFVNDIDILTKEHEFKYFPVGESVLSSFISKTRDREFPAVSDQKILKGLALNSIKIYLAVRKFIIKYRIEELFLLNGRWEYYRAALSAAREENLKIQVFENFRSGGYAEIFGNHLPHDILNKKKLIESHWDKNADLNEKFRISDDFFKKKKLGQAVRDKAYTKDQTKGKLPEAYDPTKKTFVLYNSSDDEFAAVGKQFDNPFFQDQMEGILYLTEYFQNKTDSQLIVRMHPNLKGLTKDFLKPLFALKGKYENVIIISPEEDIDTYELMDVANTVISFGSTAGLEASYWGKPVILLGKCFYFYSNVAYVPKNSEEIPLLLRTDLPPLNNVEARKFGYYLLTGGTKTTYYNNSPEKKIFFKGNLLNELPGYLKLKYKALKFLRWKN